MLQARDAVAETVLSEAWADIRSEQLVQLADVLNRVVSECPPDGRALFAAHAALDRPDPAALQVWHACTALREFRGDTHVAALVAADIGGIEAHVTACAAGTGNRATIEPHRGWSSEDWDAAETRLQARGLLTADGRLTAEGRELRG